MNIYKDHPLVSIIMITYNHERFIGDAIKSVCNQTYPYWELIIVDDGSTDKTLDIVDMLSRQYNKRKFHIIRQTHLGPKGLGSMYNRALKISSGDLVAILEGDDLWPVHKLEMQVPDFKMKDIVLSFGNYGWLYPNGTLMRTINLSNYLPYQALFNQPVGLASWYMAGLAYRTFTFPCTVLVRRSSLEKIGGFKEISGPVHLVDFPTFLNISTVGRFNYHDDVLGFWRRHLRSLTFGHNVEINEEAYKYSLQFLSHNKSLVFGNYKDVLNSWNKVFELSYIEKIRFLMVNKNWSEAKNILNAKIGNVNSIKYKIFAYLIKLFILLHMDFEIFFKVVRGYTLSEMLEKKDE